MVFKVGGQRVTISKKIVTKQKKDRVSCLWALILAPRISLLEETPVFLQVAEGLLGMDYFEQNIHRICLETERTYCKVDRSARRFPSFPAAHRLISKSNVSEILCNN